jgi:hypothetical protein
MMRYFARTVTDHKPLSSPFSQCKRNNGRLNARIVSAADMMNSTFSIRLGLIRAYTTGITHLKRLSQALVPKASDYPIECSLTTIACQRDGQAFSIS